jgi:hypothetical protein
MYRYVRCGEDFCPLLPSSALINFRFPHLCYIVQDKLYAVGNNMVTSLTEYMYRDNIRTGLCIYSSDLFILYSTGEHILENKQGNIS